MPPCLTHAHTHTTIVSFDQLTELKTAEQKNLEGIQKVKIRSRRTDIILLH